MSDFPSAIFFKSDFYGFPNFPIIFKLLILYAFNVIFPDF